MRPRSRTYHLCPVCHYMLSTALPGSGAEVTGIDDVRLRNFHHLCSLLTSLHPRVHTILDVGCSRGLFLQVAKEHGYQAYGLEPDKEISAATRASGYDVITGFFPGATELTGKTCDAIIFNDALEHIPDLPAVLAGIDRHLAADGVVIVNIPTRKGLVYQLSSILDRLGVHSLYDREWQTGFASPHVHYFDAENLSLLFERYGFRCDHTTKLLYYSLDGLWNRLRCKSSLPVSIVSYVALTVLYPLFKWRSDCFASFFVRSTI